MSKVNNIEANNVEANIVEANILEANIAEADFLDLTMDFEMGEFITAIIIRL